MKQIGGFAGVIEQPDVDTADLHPAIADRIESLVRELDFFSLPSIFPTVEIGADLPSYEITVTDAGRRNTIIFPADDDPTTARLRALADLVAEMNGE